MKLSLHSTKKPSFVFIGVFFTIQLLMVTVGFAQTNTWDGSSNNKWDKEANWSLNTVPTAAHNVVINKNVAIKVDANTTINSLTINNNATVSFVASGDSRKINIDNSGSSISSGATLTLEGSSSKKMSLGFTGNNQTVSIAGTLLLTDAGGGATYDASNSITIVSGTLRNQSGDGGTTATIVSGSNNLSFTNSGTYEHALNGGIIPSATWAASSNMIVSGMTSNFPAGTAQTFGHVSFDINSNSDIEILTNLVCQGNLSLANTGNGSLRLGGSSSRVITTGGDFTIVSGNFFQTNTTASGNITINGDLIKSGAGTYTLAGGNNGLSLTVKGNVSITAGTFVLSASGATGTLNVAGNFSHTGGTITETSTGKGEIVFNGTGEAQAFTSGGTVSNNINFIVNSNAYLQMAASNTIVTGNAFTLSDHATLGIRSAEGVSTTAATGNIRTTSRVFTAGSHFIYNGTADQVTGDALTATTRANLTIDNPGKVTSNTTAFSILGNLLVSKGNLVLLATDKDYSIAGNLTVAANTTLTHNVNWEANYTKITTAGNVAIDGNYSIGTASRAHVNMTGAGKTIHTGTSSLNILTLNNPAGSTIAADGNLTLNDNFWPSWVSAGTFNSNGKNITANAGMFIAGGIVNINGPSNITIGSLLQVGNENMSGTFNYNAGAVQVNGHINILVNGSLVNTAANSLSLTGDFTNSGVFTPGLGTMKFNGTAAQIISLSKPTLFTNMLISNTAVAVKAASDTLKVAGNISFGSVNNAIFNTADHLTLVSTATATASVGDLTNDGINSGNRIIGKVTVERFISNGAKWRLLAVPTNSTQTFKQSWQENAATASANPAAGYGVLIGDNRSNWAASGFDIYTPGGPTVKTYNAANNSWTGISNTQTAIKNAGGYMTYIRSNRSGALSATTIRTAGELYNGIQPVINVPANQFMVVGNPYAAEVNLTKINTTGLQEVFYVWDPKAGGGYGLGAYQTLVKMGNDYMVFPGGGSYGAQLSVVNTIESGQAFFVKANAAGGTIQFEENDKQAGSRLVFRAPIENSPRLRATLYSVTTDTTTLLDAAMANFDTAYTNSVDADDILKIANGSENVSIKSGTALLLADRRKDVTALDTIRLNLTGVRIQTYKWSITMDYMLANGRTAFLKDAYTNSLTPLNMDGTTEYSFTMVNIAGAYAANRFSIVFSEALVLPVTITTVSAIRSNTKSSNVTINWKVENEIGLQSYETEHSTNGSTFKAFSNVNATAGNSGSTAYTQIHTQAVDADNFYRIKAISLSGLVQYSAVVKVAAIKKSSTATISVYPNPVVNKNMNVHFLNQPAGTYHVKLLNQSGSVVYQNRVDINNSNAVKMMQLNSGTAAGIYQLLITDGNEGKSVMQVVVL